MPRVLVVTGLSPNQWDSLHLQEIGGVVRKPFGVDEVVDLVQACMRRAAGRPSGT